MAGDGLNAARRGMLVDDDGSEEQREEMAAVIWEKRRTDWRPYLPMGLVVREGLGTTRNIESYIKAGRSSRLAEGTGDDPEAAAGQIRD